MTSTKFFDAFSLVVTRGHSWSLVVNSWSLVVTRGHSWSFVVTRGHSWSLLCTFRLDPISLLEATNSWSVNIDNGFINGVIFIDLKKALDTIDHRIVLIK